MSAAVGRPIRILHVDDDPELADLAGTLLEREDDQFRVDTAGSASEGLEHLEQHPVDCVVSDYDMPGRNGIDFLDAVRSWTPIYRSSCSPGREAKRWRAKLSLPA
ncbi:response regulator [Halomicroarcula sp. GCM10025710]